MTMSNKQQLYWNSEKALLWIYGHVPPNRPASSELAIYTKYLHILKTHFKVKIKILILGSTKAFIDWAIENHLDITVVDFSTEYFATTLNNIECKNLTKHIKHDKKGWLEMDYNEQFHMIVGDLVIGNVKNEELPTFMQAIYKALKKGGMFCTKSFFIDAGYKKKDLKEIFSKYKSEMYFYHPYSSTVYDVVMSHIDDNNIINFNYLSKILRKALDEKIIDNDFLDAYKIISSHSDGHYYVTKSEEWEELAKKYFLVKKEFGEEIYSKDFPIYLLTKKTMATS